MDSHAAARSTAWRRRNTPPAQLERTAHQSPARSPQCGDRCASGARFGSPAAMPPVQSSLMDSIQPTWTGIIGNAKLRSQRIDGKLRRMNVAAMFFVCVVLCVTVGCGRKMYDPAWATQPYPAQLHTTNVLDIQVFRDNTKIKIVNSTAQRHSNFDLWINQRYVSHVETLEPGETLELSLWQFHDEYGDTFNAGGFFRTYEPTPVRLAEIHPAGRPGMVGLIAIRSEPVTVRPDARR